MNSTELALIQIVNCSPGKLITINLTCRHGKIIQTAIRCQSDDHSNRIQLLENDPCFEGSDYSLVVWAWLLMLFLVVPLLAALAMACYEWRGRIIAQQTADAEMGRESTVETGEVRYEWVSRSICSSPVSGVSLAEEGVKSRRMSCEKLVPGARDNNLTSSECSQSDRSDVESGDSGKPQSWWTLSRCGRELGNDHKESLLAASRTTECES